MNLLEKAPTLVTVAVLAVIFTCLERRIPTARSKFWKIAWFLVFIHFLAQGLEPRTGQASPALQALDWGALQASAVVFLVAASQIVEDRVKRIWALLILGVPSVAYAVLGSYVVKSGWAYALCLTACFAGGICFLFCAERRISMAPVLLSLVLMWIAFWVIRAALQGSFDPGGNALLGVGFALPGVIMYRNHYRTTPGVLTIIIGFLFWGAVFPVGMLTDRLIPQVHIPDELWNVPKMFVAFGMILAVVEDMQEALRRQATHDDLTGIWNRAGIIGILEQEMLRAERQGQSLGLILIDIDHFKTVNDTYGHRGGDGVLQALVRKIATILRPYDSFGRFGGEEFLIIAPGCDAAQTRELSDRIRVYVAAHPIALHGNEINMTVSIGVAEYLPGCKLESLLHSADTALYLAKRTGRNRVELSDQRQHTASVLSSV